MRLIVVDDDRLVVDSLKIILGAQPQIEVVGTGANGDDAVALYAEHAPDIALLDIQMPFGGTRDPRARPCGARGVSDNILG